jgi:hypothetical protein
MMPTLARKPETKPIKPASPWLKRDYKARLFMMPVDYLINHLDLPDRAKVEDPIDRWQNLKKEKVLQEINEGKDPVTYDPILLTLHPDKDVFRVGDGISKISIFKLKKIPLIKAMVQPGEW